jgi:predicted nuclease of restriction endonuclease-like RecB superfamily
MNKKIKNATVTVIDGIEFKSKLEAAVYTKFKDAGITLKYEPSKVVLQDSFEPNFKYYTKNTKDKKILTDKSNCKVREITYTPDFTLKLGNTHFAFEAKGFQNDAYPIKKKLFMKKLQDWAMIYDYVFIEIFNHKNIEQAIEIVKTYNEEKH